LRDADGRGYLSLMSQVVIIQRVLPHYRIPFFRRLHGRLRGVGIELRLVYGQERPGTVPRTVSLQETWAQRIENRYWILGGRELVWQPCLRRAWEADLVVVEQSSRLLVNYPLLALRRLRGRRIAFWGHGRNMQSDNREDWSERIKCATLGRVDWWFAYTGLSADVVAASGFPRERMTNVQNVIDTSALDAHLKACAPAEVMAVQARHGIAGGAVGLYCGGMYHFKKLPFLIAACEEIKRRVPEFSAVFVGDGPDRGVVEAAAARHDWIHYVGAKFGRDLAPYYRMSKVLLMPGLVGLAVVDSFVAGVPLFTTDLPLHSPEIAYLESGVNGVMSAHDVDAYAGSVADYLRDEAGLARLGAGCERSAAKYTIENMVENFARGVEQCLGRG
jgi:glycosyltransferase involved in cell wall biosynthesis